MNALIRKYAGSNPKERRRLTDVWDRIESRIREEADDRRFGPLLTYGRTAVEFIRKMSSSAASPERPAADSTTAVSKSPTKSKSTINRFQ